MTTSQLDKKYLFRSESTFDAELTKASESFLTDAEGKTYIDFLSGWCVGNLGWGRDELKKAIQDYDGPDYVYPHFLYKPWCELAGLLSELAPGNLNKCFRTTGGTESIDAAMQIAMAYTGRKKFLTIEGCYHGNSIGAISIGDSKSNQLKNSLSGCEKVDLPLDRKTLKKIEGKLKKKEIAAFIMEPVICNLGVLIPDTHFMNELAALCRRYGTLLVMDEVATGFGRTGRMFACEHFGIEPDVLCMAKAIGGGHAGLGAVITSDRIAQRIKNKVNIYSTFGWHPLSVHVAIANIKYMITHKKRLFDHADLLSGIFREELTKMPFRKEAELRILGLAIGVELKKASYAERIQKKCFQAGLLLMNQENVLTIFPPLTTDEATVRKGLKILEACVS